MHELNVAKLYSLSSTGINFRYPGKIPGKFQAILGKLIFFRLTVQVHFPDLDVCLLIVTIVNCWVFKNFKRTENFWLGRRPAVAEDEAEELKYMYNVQVHVPIRMHNQQPSRALDNSCSIRVPQRCFCACHVGDAIYFFHAGADA